MDVLKELKEAVVNYRGNNNGENPALIVIGAEYFSFLRDQQRVGFVHLEFNWEAKRHTFNGIRLIVSGENNYREITLYK